VAAVAARWQQHLLSGKWVFRADPFWTTPHPFWWMKQVGAGGWGGGKGGGGEGEGGGGGERERGAHLSSLLVDKAGVGKKGGGARKMEGGEGGDRQRRRGRGGR